MPNLNIQKYKIYMNFIELNFNENLRYIKKIYLNLLIKQLNFLFYIKMRLLRYVTVINNSVHMLNFTRIHQTEKKINNVTD